MDDAASPVVVRAVPSPDGMPPTERWHESVARALDAAMTAGAVSGWRLESAQAPAVDGELLLVVQPDVILLGSTVIRLVGALAPGVGAVSARQIPLAPAEGEHGCLLLAGPAESAALPVEGAVVFRDSRLDPAAEVPAPAVASLLESSLPGSRLADARTTVGAALGPLEPPLLSVVMRTQYSRPEALRDALLCLAGQTDDRFELLLVVHDRDTDAAEQLLHDQPDWLASRTRILTAVGGTRSLPLNVGIRDARGSHVAFLDDDDLVLGHWVETFLAGAVASPRTLLRSGAGVQWVTSAAWAGGVEGHSSTTGIDTPYPPVFDLADHLRVNMTPFMAFAFPREFFAVFGGADETLEVCEDWDLALRAATVLGVTDLRLVTAVYRRWSSGSDSYSLHDSTSWNAAMASVRAKLDARPLLLPPGSASELAALSGLRETPAQLAAVYASTSWRVTAPVRGLATLLERLRGGTRT